MSDLYWLGDAQMTRLRPYFPKSHGVPRVDDKRVLSGIIFINRNALRCRDAPKEYGPHKTLYNRWKLWSDMGASLGVLNHVSLGRHTDGEAGRTDRRFLTLPRSTERICRREAMFGHS